MLKPGLTQEFDALASTHRDAVYRQMLRMCGNHDDAEDVLVESLLKAYRALPQLENDAAFRVWLGQIARRSCGRLKRRESLHPLYLSLGWEVDSDGFASSDPTPEEQLLMEETHQCVLRAVGTLPPLYRDVYQMRELDGVSAEEVAGRLGLSVTAVKSRLHRARALVRGALDAEMGNS